jgi:cell wall-associated NlpC family hydrolase
LLTARTLLRALLLGGVALGLVVPASTAVAAPSPEELRQQIQKSSAALEKIVEDYNKARIQLAASQKAAAQVSAELAPLQGQLDQALVAVGQLAADAYKTGQYASVSALLDSGSSGVFLDRLGALDQIARARQTELAGVATAKARVEDRKRQLDALVATQVAAQKALTAKKTTIENDLHRLYALRRQVYGAAQESPAAAGGTSSSAPYVSGKAGIAVKYAYGALGKPYVWAADGPDGYDCSGLTLAAWRAAGVQLTHHAADQWNEVTHLSRSEIRPGDLVFYANLGHVGIYVGSGKIIHAPTFGEVVKISSVDIMTPYGYGRPG